MKIINNEASFTKEVIVKITPIEMAIKLAGMGSDDQAEFFNTFFFELKENCQRNHNESNMGFYWQLGMIEDGLTDETKSNLKEFFND
jgi:hypothetical protein